MTLARIPEDVVERVRVASDIVAVVGRSVELKKDGASYKGLCPFHEERTPSFDVSPERQTFKCFGCGAQGDVFAFVVKRDGIAFPNAVRRLADEHGIPVPDAGALATNGAAPKAGELTLDGLAADKVLPLVFLETLGLHDLRGGGVGIPYLGLDGALLYQKRRLSLAHTGAWTKIPHKQRAVPYGQDRLADARDAGYLILAEGESDCWTCWLHGFPCLGIQGADNTNHLLPEHVAGIGRIYVMDEQDAGAATFVPGIAARLSEIGWTGTPRVVRLGVKDPSELHKQDPDAFEAALRAAMEAAPAWAPSVPPVAIPVEARDDAEAEKPVEVREWPAPPSSDALFGLAGRFVSAVAPNSEADPVALLSQFLVAFGSVCGRSPHIRAEADRHGTNLFAALVGRTSKGRKGTSWGHVRAIVEGVDPEWAKARILSGLSSGEGLTHAVRDPKPARGKIPADPGEPDKRLLVFEGEMASALRVLRREGNTLSPTIRNAWDTGSLGTLTKTNAERATGAHVSIIAHITQDELRRDLDAIESGNGFANRFLWLCVRRAQELPFGGSVEADDVAWIASRMRAAIEYAQRTGRLALDSEARELWQSEYHRLSRDVPGLLGAMIGRAEAQVLRLSLIYALADQASAIRPPHLRAGLALWDYSARCAAYIFGDALGDPLADEILELLHAAPLGLTRTDLHKMLGGHEKDTSLRRALGVLLENGHVRRVVERTAGRSRERWLAAVLPGGGGASIASLASIAVAPGDGAQGSTPPTESPRPSCDGERSDQSEERPGDRVSGRPGTPRTPGGVPFDSAPTARQARRLHDEGGRA